MKIRHGDKVVVRLPATTVEATGGNIKVRGWFVGLEILHGWMYDPGFVIQLHPEDGEKYSQDEFECYHESLVTVENWEEHYEYNA